MGKKSPVEVIAEVELYKYAPWDLPDKSFLRDGDLKWYFFCPKGKKYASGARVNRATEVGYWKTTGKDRSVHHNDQIVGMIKTLVFHMGRPPGGDRTDWVMHEFRLEDKELTDKGIPQDSYVLCRVFQKDGRGPRNGAQYGKPYNEEDWDDDEEGIDCVEAVPLAAVSAPVPNLPIAHNSSAATDMNLSPSGCIGSSSMSYLSGLMPSPCLMHHSIPSDQVISNDVSQVPVDDDIILMMNCFTDDNTLALNGNNKIEKVDNSGQQKDVEVPCLIGGDIFKGLGDLDNLVGLNEEGNDCTWGQKAGYTTSQMPFMGDVSFLELLDLDFPFQHESCGRSDPEHEGLAIEKGETEKRENSCK